VAAFGQAGAFRPVEVGPGKRVADMTIDILSGSSQDVICPQMARHSKSSGTKGARPPEKRTDEIFYLTGKRRGACLCEEVWYEGREVVKYNLAYINHRRCSVDNGRVLGYDNSRDYHHRHYMGHVEKIEFPGYAALASHFQNELQELWRLEDEEGH